MAHGAGCFMAALGDVPVWWRQVRTSSRHMAATGTLPDFFNYKYINVADYEYRLYFHCLLEYAFPMVYYTC